MISDLNNCDVVDIKDDKNDGYLFSLRINKTVHELCADTEQVRFIVSYFQACVTSIFARWLARATLLLLL